jgi:hypothetical protein
MVVLDQPYQAPLRDPRRPLACRPRRSSSKAGKYVGRTIVRVEPGRCFHRPPGETCGVFSEAIHDRSAGNGVLPG